MWLLRTISSDHTWRQQSEDACTSDDSNSIESDISGVGEKDLLANWLEKAKKERQHVLKRLQEIDLKMRALRERITSRWKSNQVVEDSD